jgi:hypothetical protein
MLPEQNDRIPDWAARERQADMAWIHDNLSIFWPRAEELFQSHGRGAFVADTNWQSLDGGMPIGYFPQALFEQDQGSDVRRMVREYRPTEEFVMHLLKPHGHESTYRVRVRRREAEGADQRQALQLLLLQTFEQNDGLCLDEEAERQLLAAILSSVITDLLEEESPLTGPNLPPDNEHPLSP